MMWLNDSPWEMAAWVDRLPVDVPVLIATNCPYHGAAWMSTEPPPPPPFPGCPVCANGDLPASIATRYNNHKESTDE